MRTFSTSQVVRLLELHPEDKFSAPRKRSGMKTINECRASRDSADNKFVRFEEKRGGRWVPVMMSCIDLRSDWTRVKPAKVKRERLNLGTFKTNASGNQDGLGLGLADAALKLYHMASNTTGTWTLYAVKDGRK